MLNYTMSGVRYEYTLNIYDSNKEKIVEANLFLMDKEECEKIRKIIIKELEKLGFE